MELAGQKSQQLIDAILRWMTFGAAGIAVFTGPWFFGAWEVWWFWPFVVVICVGTLTAGLRLLLSPSTIGTVPGRVWIAGGAMLPFIVYAVVRMFLADVYVKSKSKIPQSLFIQLFPTKFQSRADLIKTLEQTLI